MRWPRSGSGSNTTKFEEAIVAYREALKSRSAGPRLRTIWAFCSPRSGRGRAARRSSKRQLPPIAIPAIRILAASEALAGHAMEAQKAIERLRKLQPEDSRSQSIRSLFAQMGYAKLACRNECSTISIASNPSSAPPGECRPSSADRRHSATANSASGPRADLSDQRDHVRSGNPETGLGKSDIAFKQFETTRRAA